MAEDPHTDAPSPRAYSARAMFEAKVIILEEWVRSGVSPGKWVPKNISELARWSDSALGLSVWKKPNVHSPNGNYGDLRLRADVALKHLNTVASLAKPTSATELTQSLIKQIVRLRGELGRAQESYKIEKDRADEFERRNQQLLRELRSLKSLARVKP